MYAWTEDMENNRGSERETCNFLLKSRLAAQLQESLLGRLHGLLGLGQEDKMIAARQFYLGPASCKLACSLKKFLAVASIGIFLSALLSTFVASDGNAQQEKLKAAIFLWNKNGPK